MVDPDTKIAILATIGEMADDMSATWDSALSWATVVDSLADMVTEAGEALPQPYLAILLVTAAMARRQALKAPDGEVQS